MLTDNRFVQIAYPVIIFFSLLLAWNSVGQDHGFAQNHSNRNPAQIQNACSTGHLSFPEARSCNEGNQSLIQSLIKN